MIGIGFHFYKEKVKRKTFLMEEVKTQTKKEEKIALSPKKVALIIAFRDFRDIEYFRPYQILTSAGIEVKSVSDKLGTAVGADGGEVEVDILLEDLLVDEFDGIFFIGGPGALDHLDNEKSYQVAKEALEKGKILGAICISPVILAKAKVLEGKRATVWSSLLDKSGINILKENGAIYVDEAVVFDSNIITANGPQSADEFANKIKEILLEK